MTEVKYDTFYRRIFAKITDYILIGILIKIFTLFIPDSTFQFDFNNPNFEKGLIQNSNPLLDYWTAYGETTSSVILILYFIIFNFLFGQTIGKMIVSVKIRDISEENKITFIQAILRNISDITFAIFSIFITYEYINIILILIWLVANLIQILSNKKYRTIDDLIAKTVVLRILETKDFELNENITNVND